MHIILGIEIQNVGFGTVLKENNRIVVNFEYVASEDVTVESKRNPNPKKSH